MFDNQTINAAAAALAPLTTSHRLRRTVARAVLDAARNADTRTVPAWSDGYALEIPIAEICEAEEAEGHPQEPAHLHLRYATDGRSAWATCLLADYLAVAFSR
jgi:hypothetical protein